MSTNSGHRLGSIAHGRSGDKGNHANVAVIAYTPAGFAWLRENLTAERVRDYFAPLKPTKGRAVRGPEPARPQLPAARRARRRGEPVAAIDTQGKTLALALLQMPVDLPADHAAMLRPTR